MSFLTGITRVENDTAIRYIKENEALTPINTESDINSLFQYLYDNILNPNLPCHISLTKSCNVIKSLLQLTNKKSILTEKFYDCLDTFMVTKFELLYAKLTSDSEDNMKNDFFYNRRYPIIRFYEKVSQEFDEFVIIMYPLFHGLNITMETAHLPKFKQSLSKFEKIELLSPTGYPISEIHIFMNHLFLTYIHDHSEKLYDIGNSKMKFSNETVKRLVNDFKIELEKENSADNKFGDSKILDVFKLGLYFSKLNDDPRLSNMLQKAVLQACKNLKNELYVKDNEFKIFKKLKRIITNMENFEKSMFKIDEEFKKFIIRPRAELIFEDKAFYMNSICSSYRKIFYDENNDKNDDGDKEYEENIKVGLELYDTWKPAACWIESTNNFIFELSNSIEIINEDKLKEMVKYFDNVTKIILKLKKLEYLNLKENNITFHDSFAMFIIRDWNSKFKRDFIGHYSYYLDYKLKSIPKSKDRIKLEKSIQELIETFKIIYCSFNINQKLKFKKRYVTLLIQRLLSTLFENNEVLSINICDCEEDFGLQFDEINKNYFNNEVESEISATIKDFIYSYNKFQEFNKMKSDKNNDNDNDNEHYQIIGLKNIYNLNSDIDNNETLSNAIVLKSEIEVFKDYKKWIRKKLINDKIVSSYCKIKLNLDYSLSKYEIKFSLGDNEDSEYVTLIVNMYQGLILQLFNEFDELSVDRISKILKLDAELVAKNLSILNNRKHPILNFENTENGEIWKVNEDFKVNEKIKNGGGLIMIK